MLGKIRWTIAMKVGGIIAVLIVFILCLLIHSIISLQDIQADLQEISAFDIPLTEISNEIEITQLELHIEMDELLSLGAADSRAFSKDTEQIKELTQRVFTLIEQGVAIADKGAKSVEPGSVENFQRISRTLQELQAEFVRINKGMNQLIANLAAHNTANAELTANILKEDEQFDLKGIMLIRAIESLTERKAQLALKHEQMFKVVNISLGAIGVSLGVILGVLIVLGIKTNILRLSKQMESVTAALQENREIPLDEIKTIQSSDELGALSQGLTTLIDSLSADITKRERLSRKLNELATIDHLTQSYNRFKWDEDCASEIERAKATGADLSLISFDIDHFKRINDTYGHDIGDKTLIDVVKVAHSAMRTMDSLYRTGGEEFAVLLPGTNINAGAHLAERIRAAIEQHDFEQVGAVTISLGVTQFNGAPDTGEEFAKRADQALYHSKETGRNKVTSQ